MYVLLVTASHNVSNGAQGHLAKKVGSVRSYRSYERRLWPKVPLEYSLTYLSYDLKGKKYIAAGSRMCKVLPTS